jgi:hypothetical protein
MQLAYAIDVFYHTLLAIIAGILAFEVDDAYSFPPCSNSRAVALSGAYKLNYFTTTNSSLKYT